MSRQTIPMVVSSKFGVVGLSFAINTAERIEERARKLSFIRNNAITCYYDLLRVRGTMMVCSYRVKILTNILCVCV